MPYGDTLHKVTTKPEGKKKLHKQEAQPDLSVERNGTDGVIPFFEKAFCFENINCFLYFFG